jgi:hypothetical protein
VPRGKKRGSPFGDKNIETWSDCDERKETSVPGIIMTEGYGLLGRHRSNVWIER